MFPQTWSVYTFVQCSSFLKIMERWSGWSSRAEVQQWNTSFTKTKYVDTKNQLEYILTKGNFTRDEEISSSPSGQYQHFRLWQLPSNHVAKNATRNWRRENLWQSRSRRWTWFRVHTLRVARTFFWHIFLAWRTDIAYTHGSRWSQCACHVSPSHPLPSSCFIRLPLPFPDGHFETTFPTWTSAPSLPNWSRSESASQAHFRTSGGGVWLPDRSHALHRLWAQRVRQDYLSRRRHDAHQRSEQRKHLWLLEHHTREHWTVRCFHNVRSLCFARFSWTKQRQHASGNRC